LGWSNLLRPNAVSIASKVELLRSQPRMGVRRSDIRESMRMLVELPHLVRD
jgi:toxin ParE1/3/4